MKRHSSLTRRSFILRTGAVGCSVAASPLMTPVTYAAAPWENRLVVILLRGAMDGLDVVQPYGDKMLAGLRRKLAFGPESGAQDLDGFFALHAGLKELMPLWEKGQLAFAHAVSTPYRDKRSHFDGQDILEAGTAEAAGADGWLNRMLQTVPGAKAHTAYAIGRGEMLLLKGAAPVANWSPETRLEISPATQRLLETVYHDDALFRPAMTEALALVQELDSNRAEAEGTTRQKPDKTQMKATRHGRNHLEIANFAAERLNDDSRIVAFSLNGWDSHNNQSRVLKAPLNRLQETILTLQAGLGEVWEKTAILAMTEFGRTAHENGTGGTDHGTGGAMLMAGGAVRGGRIYTDWPGLGQQDLYQGRDLMPTADVRSYAAQAIRGLFGLDKNVLERVIFPKAEVASVERIIR